MLLSVRSEWDRPNRPPDGVTEHILLIGLTPNKALPALPGDYCVLLDCSGSMRGKRLEDARNACRMAVNNLNFEDTISLVAFNREPEVLFCRKTKADLANDGLEVYLARLEAYGVTRADLALSEAQKILVAGKRPGRTSTILLITDGHPTNQEGRKIDNYLGLYTLADDLAAANIHLITVGLGSAENYNSTFLTTLADHGKGCFCYAPESSKLSVILNQEFNALQSSVINGLDIQLTARMQGVTINEFCRMTPQYLPLEQIASETGKWIYSCGTLGTESDGAETLFLVRVETHGRFGMEASSYPILEISYSWESNSGERQAGPESLAYLKYTPVLREQQEVNHEVQQLRLRWEMNLYQKELARSTNNMRTGMLLLKITSGAKQLQLPQVEEQANTQLRQLKEAEHLDQNNLALTGQLIRSTGYIDIKKREQHINQQNLGIGFGGGKKETDRDSDQVLPDREPLSMDLAALKVIRGRQTGVCIPLNKVNLIIGRASKIPVDIDLNSQEQGDVRLVSRRHAGLSWEQGKLMIRDLGSATGTFVNNERLQSPGTGQAGDARELKCGDLLRLADIELKLIVQ